MTTVSSSITSKTKQQKETSDQEERSSLYRYLVEAKGVQKARENTDKVIPERQNEQIERIKRKKNTENEGTKMSLKKGAITRIGHLAVPVHINIVSHTQMLRERVSVGLNCSRLNHYSNESS